MALVLSLVGFAHAQNSVTVTVTPPAPTAEGDQGNQKTFNFRITTDRAVTSDLVFSVSTRDGTGPNAAMDTAQGALGADYQGFTNRTFIIRQGGNAVNVPVIVFGDNNYEFDENFSIVVTKQSGTENVVFANGNNSAAATILNDDQPPLISLQTPPGIFEGNSGQKTLNFTVFVTPASGRPVTVNFTTRDGSARAGEDFIGQTNQSQTVPVGTEQFQHGVQIIGDTRYEGDEAFTLIVTSPNNDAQIDPTANTATGTILDDDLPNYTISDASTTEGGDAVFQITLVDNQGRNPQAQGPVTFQYQLTDGSATLVSDYQPNGQANGTFTINPGSRSFLLRIPTVDDSISEPNETFNVVITSVNGALDAPDNTGVGTILDNDGAPTITVGDAQVVEGTGGSTRLDFPVSLSSGSSTPVTVSFQTVDDNTVPANRRATANQDYTSQTGTITFPATTGAGAPNTLRTISITITPDSVNELDESFRLRLFNPTNASFGGNATQIFATGTILDDDNGTISFTQATQSPDENTPGRFATFAVRLSAVSQRTVTVDYTTKDGTAVANGNGPGQRDYFAKSGTLTFPPGSNTQNILVEIIDDNVFEGNEDFTVTLNNPNGATLGAIPIETATIVDNERAPRVRITPSVLGVAESDNTFTFNLFLLDKSQEAITVNYELQDGSATGGADYVAATGSVTFKPGVSAMQIPVTIKDDQLFEGNENFTVNLSVGAGTFSFENNITSATVVIVDNDDQPRLSISDFSAPEGNPADANGPTTPFTFQVNLSRPSGRAVSFNYSTVNIKQQDCIPDQGCDVAQSSDYIGVRNVPVTIPAGETTATVTIQVNRDIDNELDEQFGVVLRSPVGASFSNDIGYGTIINDDKAGGVTITAPQENAIEDYFRLPGTLVFSRAATFTVKLSAPTGRGFSLNYVVTGAPAPAANGSDVDAPFGTITFQPGQDTQTFTVRASADQIDEPTENLRVAIFNQQGFAPFRVDPTKNTADTTIQDRTVVFNGFSPNSGFDQLPNQNPTLVTLTGDQFRTDDLLRVQSVLFNGLENNPVEARVDEIVNDNTIRVFVPFGARTGPLSVRLTDGTILRPTDRGSQGNFFVLPVITSFSPPRGVIRNTQVTIKGRRFTDGLNPVTAVLFNGIASTGASSGNDFRVVDDSTIIATVPDNATSGPITIVTRNGNGPVSATPFTVDGFNPGGLFFDPNPDLSPILENESGTAERPIHRYLLNLQPARQNDGNGDGTILPPRGSVRVNISISDNTDPGANPELTVRAAIGTNRNFNFTATGGSINLDLPAGYDVSRQIEVDVTYAGDDVNPPLFVLNGFFQQPADTSRVTVNASITQSRDNAFYPVGSTLAPLTVSRYDIHGLDTNIGNVLRTSEDQNSPNNSTSFPLNLRNTAPIGPTGKLQPQTFNPDGTFNDDAVPGSDVFLPLFSSRPDEALITYYVEVKDPVLDANGNPVKDANGKVVTTTRRVYPAGAVPRDRISVIYATNPSRAEYYGNAHYIQAFGQDDALQDGPQTYQIILDTSDNGGPNSNNPNLNSTDPEYKFKLVAPFVLINDDNEQSTNNNEKGFVFSRVSGTPPLPRLQVSEGGSQDTVSVRLRARPSSDVTLVLRTNAPDVVRLVDPRVTGPAALNGGDLTDTLRLTFRVNSTGTGLLETRFDQALNITVRGIDDTIRNDGGGRTGTIVTTVETADPAYSAIDPSDIVVFVTDNESDSITVLPSNIVIDEGDTKTFSVRLNSRPTAPVTISLTSSDPSVAFVTSANRLTFDSTNFSTDQTVTVSGVRDGTFTPQRTANIITSNASSSDPNYNGRDVPDVTVNVQNTETAFSVTPTSGLETSEDGRTSSFTVRLLNAPSQNVTISLASSDTGEALISTNNGTPAGTATLLFTQANFNTAQTVTVTGQDDNVVDGPKPFTITGSISTGDPGFAQQRFPTVSGSNLDNDSGNAGAAVEFSANTTSSFSVPFSSSGDGSVAQSEVFFNDAGNALSPASGAYQIYRFNAAGQINRRTNDADFVPLSNTDRLQRGVGYRIQTFNQRVILRNGGSNLQTIGDTSFSLNLTRNTNFAAQTNNQSNSVNGYNYIGFPFNPSQFTSVDFTQAQVIVDGVTRSLSDAAAAGLINPNLYAVDAQGNLTRVSPATIQKYKAYVVQIYRDNVTLVLRNPTR